MPTTITIGSNRAAQIDLAFNKSLLEPIEQRDKNVCLRHLPFVQHVQDVERVGGSTKGLQTKVVNGKRQNLWTELNVNKTVICRACLLDRLLTSLLALLACSLA